MECSLVSSSALSGSVSEIFVCPPDNGEALLNLDGFIVKATLGVAWLISGTDLRV